MTTATAPAPASSRRISAATSTPAKTPSTPQAPVPFQRPAPPRALPRLRCWVSAIPTGVNHQYEGTDIHRHLTAAAKSWGESVWASVAAASTTLHLPRAGWGEQLGMRLHFYVVRTRTKSGKPRRTLDVDAPVKLTQDRACQALGIDDERVRRLDVVRTVVEDTRGPGGYGRSAGGVWIEVWRLSAAEIRKIEAEQPGRPA